RLFKKMRRTGNNYELLFTTQLRIRFLVHPDYRKIKAANDQQRWRPNFGQCVSSKIRSSASRDDCADLFTKFCGSNQRRTSAGTGSKVAYLQMRSISFVFDPVSRIYESFCE